MWCIGKAAAKIEDICWRLSKSYENFIQDVHFGDGSYVSHELRRDLVVLASGAGLCSGHCRTVASARSYG